MKQADVQRLMYNDVQLLPAAGNVSGCLSAAPLRNLSAMHAGGRPMACHTFPGFSCFPVPRLFAVLAAWLSDVQTCLMSGCLMSRMFAVLFAWLSIVHAVFCAANCLVFLCPGCFCVLTVTIKLSGRLIAVVKLCPRCLPECLASGLFAVLTVLLCSVQII